MAAKTKAHETSPLALNVILIALFIFAKDIGIALYLLIVGDVGVGKLFTELFNVI